MKTGIELIAEERARQVSQERWTAEHDDEHEEGQMALAAACYALTPFARNYELSLTCKLLGWLWPWSMEWWKPSPENRVRELTKAGALIAAEIDRLHRAEHAEHEASARNEENHPMKPPFFMVVDATGSLGGEIPSEKAPKKMHKSIKEAMAEAGRLALRNPERRFVVLQSIGEAQFQPAKVNWNAHHQATARRWEF